MRPFFIQGPFVFPLFRVSFLSLLKSSEPIVFVAYLFVCLCGGLENYNRMVQSLGCNTRKNGSIWSLLTINIQSICTLIFIFLGSGTLKNIRLHQPYFLRSEPYFFCLQFAREEARLPLFFLSNKKSPGPNLCTLFFAPHILDPIFSGSQTDPCFQI